MVDPITSIEKADKERQLVVVYPEVLQKMIADAIKDQLNPLWDELKDLHKRKEKEENSKEDLNEDQDKERNEEDKENLGPYPLLKRMKLHKLAPPEKYGGEQDVEVMDSWICSMQEYFFASCIEPKYFLSTVSNFMKGNALVWWRNYLKAGETQTPHYCGLGKFPNCY